MSTIADRLRTLQALPAVAPVQAAAPVAPAEASAPVMPARTLPVRPSSIKGRARVMWDDAVDELSRLGVLDQLDAGALARYCILRVEWDELTAQLRSKKGRYFVTYPGGSQQISAQFVARRQVAAELAALEDQLGMTPTARARLLFQTYGARPLGKPKAPAARGTPRGPRGAYRKKGGAEE